MTWIFHKIRDATSSICSFFQEYVVCISYFPWSSGFFVPVVRYLCCYYRLCGFGIAITSAPKILIIYILSFMSIRYLFCYHVPLSQPWLPSQFEEVKETICALCRELLRWSMVKDDEKMLLWKLWFNLELKSELLMPSMSSYITIALILEWPCNHISNVIVYIDTVCQVNL